MEHQAEKKWTSTEGVISFILTAFELSLYAFFPFFQKFVDSLPSLLTGGALTAFGLFSSQAAAIHFINIKFPQISKFFKKLYSRVFVRVSVLVLVLLIFSMSISFCLFRRADQTPPAITVIRPENDIIPAQSTTHPLIYQVSFDDETALGKIDLNEDALLLENCAADVQVAQIDDHTCIIYVNNITGNSGEHTFGIKEGAIKDHAGNKSKEISLPAFYLFNSDADIDKSAPEITMSAAEYYPDGSISINVTATDDRELSRLHISRDHILLIDIQADVEITGTALAKTITLSNIKGTGTFRLAIVAGVAKDMWNNPSAAYISQDIFIK